MIEQVIAPMVHNIKTSLKVYSTYNDNINMDLTHLEELVQRANYINNNFCIDDIQVDACSLPYDIKS